MKSFKFQVSSFRLAITIIALTALLLSTTGFKSCSQSEKDRNVAIAKDILAGCRAAAPIIATKAPGFVAKWTEVVSDGEKLVTAATASDAASIGPLLRSMLPTITEVAGSLSSDANFQLAFALAQIGLNFYLDHFLPQTTAVAAKAGKTREASAAISNDDTDIVRRFRALPQFGCQLHPARCQ